MSDTKKINWMSVLQGWSMLLVVIGHVDLNNQSMVSMHPIANLIKSIIYGFHMPLFMFISGYLFYLTRISKDRTYISVIKDKFKRLYIPMLFFTLVAFVPKILLAPLMNHPAHLTLQYFFNVFLLYKENPLAEMWFVISLLEIMLLFPLYKWADNNLGKELGLLLLFVVLGDFTITCDYFQLLHVVYMLPFFYGGALMCKYNLSKYIEGKWGLAISLSLFITVNVLGSKSPSQVINLIGIIFSFSLCLNISKLFPSLFSSFRNYTYQIFLMGIFFQMMIRYLYSASELLSNFYWLLFLLSTFVGVFIPVFLSKIVKHFDSSWLNICFGLK
jgi:hypothetical protein